MSHKKYTRLICVNLRVCPYPMHRPHVIHVCLHYSVVSVPCSLVITCLGKGWPLGCLVCDAGFLVCFSLSIWLYRFLIFAFFFTYVFV